MIVVALLGSIKAIVDEIRIVNPKAKFAIGNVWGPSFRARGILLLLTSRAGNLERYQRCWTGRKDCQVQPYAQGGDSRVRHIRTETDLVEPLC